MSLHPTTLLGLLLCLGQTIHTWNEVLPKPSICAKTDTVVHRGRPVTIVCQSSAGADIFCLEKDRRVEKRDQRNVSQHGSQGAEARFHITASEVTAGHYFCRYQKGNNWSKISELLELVVTDEDVSALPSGLSTESVYILIGISVAFLLCLLLLVVLLVHRLRQKNHGPPISNGEKQSPQERFSPAIDIIQRTPDVATVGKLPEGDRELHALPPPLILGRTNAPWTSPSEPCCRRPPGGDICPAGPPSPHTEGSWSPVPAVHGAHS
ncbi:leukocyte-associated immunoglobulin-like receptor 1 isoform X1 [Pteropus vampyrus]|uniref:Leukocyte-associated immunoglobulin-like receptor 1 isoform X1 n=1 Tax=Pteropus vampyrus TaxID=132908 RepID=A0A6P6C4R9_PTEVA|nr:leukocyte-associated immunoglobulin-like receptor 1 isoform X1 [Pteropus vampyrus]